MIEWNSSELQMRTEIEAPKCVRKFFKTFLDEEGLRDENAVLIVV
jgi:hypothetical protein